MLQLSLFDPNPAPIQPDQFGLADVSYADATAILTRPTGRLADLDFTLNPYQGCTFACTYCYAAFFTADEARRESWGRWVRVKTNALEKLRNCRHDLRRKSVLMSSATDPYQPIERRLELTRSLLPILARRGAHLTVQTRSPLVTRDVDLFHEFERLRVNLSITDRFGGRAPAVRAAVREHRPAASTPPLSSSKRGCAPASALGRCCRSTIRPSSRAGSSRPARMSSGSAHSHESAGPFAANTRQPALKIAHELGWTPERRQDGGGRTPPSPRSPQARAGRLERFQDHPAGLATDQLEPGSGGGSRARAR